MYQMRTIIISASIVTIAIIGFALSSLHIEAKTGYSKLYLDNFSKSKPGKFPRRWRTWPLQRGDASKVYAVAEEEGRRFIKAYDAYGTSQQIFFNFNWEVKKRPMLSWKWRATALPAGAAESDDNRNDSACGVYVVIGRYKGHALKYVWSTTLAPGTVVTRRDGNLKIKVLDSGSSNINKWIVHKVDVLKDYKDLFGKPLNKNPSGIGILTDSNAVHKPAGCDYKAFAISGNSS